MLHLSIVILNYRTPGMLIDCLETLDGQVDGQRRRVVVVDNCSGDGSAARIAQAIAERGWGHWAELVESPVNGGFAAGNNVGIQHQDAAFYLLLNSDTLVRPRALDRLLAFAQAHPQAGIVGPRLEWPDGQPQISCFRDHSPGSQLIDGAHTGPVTRLLQRWDVPIALFDEPRTVGWTSFACALIRRELMQQLGGLDEGYFMYFEDADFCLHARRLGWQVWHEPAAHVVHLRGGSGSVKSDVAKRRRPPVYLYRSRARYFRRAYGPLGPLAANLAWQAGRLLALLREALGKPTTACERQWRDNWIDCFKR